MHNLLNIKVPRYNCKLLVAVIEKAWNDTNNSLYEHRIWVGLIIVGINAYSKSVSRKVSACELCSCHFSMSLASKPNHMWLIMHPSYM